MARLCMMTRVVRKVLEQSMMIYNDRYKPRVELNMTKQAQGVKKNNVQSVEGKIKTRV